MEKSFNKVKLYGGFPIDKLGGGAKIVSLIKRSAVRFNLIPDTLKGRAYLKRIFMGKLMLLPHEIAEGMISYEPPIEISVNTVNRQFKILYAIGEK